jgi:hypothetical protein
MSDSDSSLDISDNSFHSPTSQNSLVQDTVIETVKNSKKRPYVSSNSSESPSPTVQ